MQPAERISLNAIRIFSTVADCGSLKLAACRLGVTPGAVSHQVRGLEEAMGVQLFQRTNNSIRLTETGELLFRQSMQGLSSLERAIRTAMNGNAEVSVSVPLTLATRWLIPGLETFQSRNPDIRVRIETTTGISTDNGHDADVVIAYFPRGAIQSHAEIVLEDRCRPYLSAALLVKLGDVRDLEKIPALQCARGNWDWRLWLEESGRSSTTLAYAGHFDLDDARLACSHCWAGNGIGAGVHRAGRSVGRTAVPASGG